MIPYINTRELILTLMGFPKSTNDTEAFEYVAGPTGASVDECNKALNFIFYSVLSSSSEVDLFCLVIISVGRRFETDSGCKATSEEHLHHRVSVQLLKHLQQP